MRKELEKNYDPKDIEDRLYSKWISKKYFHAEVNPDKKPYTIVIPPPNITGQLHMGHALDNTLQDILIRFKRMQGYEALWLPGTDHASIATEAKIVEAMRNEGITKEDIGREKFLERAWDWKKQYGGRIVSQLKKMGSSCDWDRERFTMDEGCNKAVKEVFVKLYNKGLIYRGERIINWCPHCLTSISDAEVEYEDQKGHFWHLRYPFADGSGYINLATTRPETLLGDTAVAVNPNDERYKDLVGKMLVLPLVHREIPLIADDYVDMEFGTGVVKITPAHDPNDFEVGLRHNLPIINVMTDDAKIVDEYEKYAGMDRYEAREAIVKDLEAEGALVKVEDHDHNVGTCYRCGTTVEPRVSKQWFVKMKPLAGPAIDAVKNGETKFVPDHFNKTYFHWLENIRDWCISRQLWWGHQIPAFYCDDCGELVVTKEKTCNCPKCGKEMRQDPDTLDTWFSSALWPFSTLGWPDDTEEMKYFYPTNTLVTGYDIIPFWVNRMTFQSLELNGIRPFKDVIIHGLVRDKEGRKMSKSLGNGIDPMDMIKLYGADSLRYYLVTDCAFGTDLRFDEEKLKATWNFINKMWNASRFVLMNIADLHELNLNNLKKEDKWILTRFENVLDSTIKHMDKYEFNLVGSEIYNFIWDDFCSNYIEMAKFSTDDVTTKSVLYKVLTGIIKIMHPFMPFVTEEIYQNLPFKDSKSIMISNYPQVEKEYIFNAETKEVDKLLEFVTTFRNKKLENNAGKDFEVETKSLDDLAIKLLKLDDKIVTSSSKNTKILVSANKIEAYICYDNNIDKTAVLNELMKKKETLESSIKRRTNLLNNENYVKKAPENIVTKERLDLEKETSMLNNVLKEINELN